MKPWIFELIAIVLFLSCFLLLMWAAANTNPLGAAIGALGMIITVMAYETIAESEPT